MGTLHYLPDDHHQHHHSREAPLLPPAGARMSATTHLGSTHSSPSSFEEDVPAMMGGGGWQPMQLPAPGSAGSSTTSSMPTKAPLPLQKRRRVTRACDECRRKKIKCDGKQPCTHCTVYSYECTYDQPSNRRRNPAPQYIEALENRLQRTEALLKAILPDVDVNNSDFDPVTLLPQIQAAATEKITKACNANNGSIQNARPSEGSTSAEKDSLLQSMVEAAGRLDIDETGHMDFHGQSSSMTFLAHLNSQFGALFGGDVKFGSNPFPSPTHTRPAVSPQSSADSPHGESLPDTSVLPPRPVGLGLVEACFDDACILLRFTHRPSFMAMFDRVYDISPDKYGEDEQTFIPLLYLAMAVGCLFVSDHGSLGIEDINAEAVKYFNSGRRMIEMTDIRDLHSVQAVILMIIFLQVTSRMSTCYSYVGIALSAALRLGLHRSLPNSGFNPIEREVRRRVFWTLWKMDTYVGALLGLPKGIADDDIDQQMPVEIDDEFITKDAILPQPAGTLAAVAAANRHTLLMKCLAKIVKHIYPLKGVEASITGKGLGYSVSMGKLHEIESDMARWLDDLPMLLRPGGDTPAKYLKMQYLLKIGYAHVQMMLYRPFLHYISRPRTKGCDERPYAIASNCVAVSRKIVSITEEMRQSGILNGAYWFTIYTTFFAVITLVYYVLVNPPDQSSYSILQKAKIGRDCLWSVKEKSMAARRCTHALESLFEKIPQKVTAEMEKAVANSNSKKKKRTRATSQSRLSGSEDDSYSQSSRGTRSASGSMASSPARRTKPLPNTSIIDTKRMSTPILPLQTSSAADPMHRRSSYEMYRDTDFSSLKSGNPSQQSYQTQLADSSLPDLSAMVFSPTGPYDDYQSQSMGPPPQPQFKTEPNPTSPGLFSPSAGYESLEGNLFGPLPPYLLQGQQQMMGGCIPAGGIPGSEAQRTGSNGPGLPSQFYMNNGGGESMVPDFFRDEWDDAIMQQAYRA